MVDLACNLSNQWLPNCHSVKSKIKEVFILRRNITLSRKDMQVLSIFFTYALAVYYCSKLTILHDEKKRMKHQREFGAGHQIHDDATITVC